MAEQAERWIQDAKDVTAAIQDYNPAIPAELVEYYAKKQGLSIEDPQVAKLIAISTEAFLSGVLGDAVELTRKLQTSTAAARKDAPENESHKKGLTLHMDVLAKALADSGVNKVGSMYKLS